MTVPYIYPLTEARAQLSTLVKAMVAGDSRPALMGQYGRPQVVLVTWDLFDHMRDLLSELDSCGLCQPFRPASPTPRA